MDVPLCWFILIFVKKLLKIFPPFCLQVPAQKLTKAAFWTQVDEERLASQSLVDNLMDKFGTKPIVKENQMNGGDEGSGNGTGTIGEDRALNLNLILV